MRKQAVRYAEELNKYRNALWDAKLCDHSDELRTGNRDIVKSRDRSYPGRGESLIKLFSMNLEFYTTVVN